MNNNASHETQHVGVIGTGNFAKALAKRLYTSGYDVIIGSRKPEKRNLSAIDQCFCDIVLTSIENCIKRCSIIFVAIHSDNYKDTLSKHDHLLQGKTLVDVSNTDKRNTRTVSNAQYLQSLFPSTVVVKGFNVLSAYQLEYDISGGSKQVFIASDDKPAREQVSAMARNMGYVAVDFGSLQFSKKIELFPHGLFTEWKVPVIVAIGVFNMWFLFAIYLYYISRTAYGWGQLFVKVPNKPICMTAITMLSLAYLPGSIAGFLQLYYGTKHQRFPKWFDIWMRRRKQFGLVAFGLATMHAIMSVLIMSPTYLRSWYNPINSIISVNTTSEITTSHMNWMIWKGEASCLTGIIAYLAMCVVAISTIPSVADTLNWKEWRFVQSKLGFFLMTMTTAHVVVMGMPSWIKNPESLHRSITFLSVQLPLLTIVLRVILLFPCLSRQLRRIRRGWERVPKECKMQYQNPKPDSQSKLICRNEDSFRDQLEMKCSQDCKCADIV